MGSSNMTQITPPFVPPNWKEINNYPDPLNTTNEEYAWEFLRRNPEYQSDWNTYLTRVKTEANGDADLMQMLSEAFASPSAFKPFYKAFWGDGLRVNGVHVPTDNTLHHDYVPAPTRRPYAKWKDLDTSLGKKDPFYPDMQSKGQQSLSGEFAAKWRLHRMVNPTWHYSPGEPEPPYFTEASAVYTNGLLGYVPEHLADVERRERLRQGKPETANVLQFGRLAAIIVDLERPIEVIEAEFSRYLRAMQEWRVRNKAIKLNTSRGKTLSTRWQYTEFLRLFDALSDQNPNPTAIDKVLEVMFSGPNFTDVKTVRARRNRACALVAGEYQTLLSLADPVTYPALGKN